MGEKCAAYAMRVLACYADACVRQRRGLRGLARELSLGAVLDTALARLTLQHTLAPVHVALPSALTETGADAETEKEGADADEASEASEASALARYSQHWGDGVAVLNADAVLAAVPAGAMDARARTALGARTLRQLATTATAAAARADLDRAVATTLAAALCALCEAYAAAVCTRSSTGSSALGEADCSEVARLAEACAVCALQRGADARACACRCSLYGALAALLQVLHDHSSSTSSSSSGSNKSDSRDRAEAAREALEHVEGALVASELFLAVLLRDTLADDDGSGSPGSETGATGPLRALALTAALVVPAAATGRCASPVLPQYVADCAVAAATAAAATATASPTAVLAAARLRLLAALAGAAVPGAELCARHAVPALAAELRVGARTPRAVAAALYACLAAAAENALTDAALAAVLACTRAACAADMLATLLAAAPHTRTVAPLLTAAAAEAEAAEQAASEQDVEQEQQEEERDSESVGLRRLCAVLRLVVALARRTGFAVASAAPREALVRVAVLQLFGVFCGDADRTARALGVAPAAVLDVAVLVAEFCTVAVRAGARTLFVLPRHPSSENEDENDESENDDENEESEDCHPSVEQLVVFAEYTLRAWARTAAGTGTGTPADTRVPRAVLERAAVHALTLLAAQTHAWAGTPLLAARLQQLLGDRLLRRALAAAARAAGVTGELGALVESVDALLATRKRPRCE